MYFNHATLSKLVRLILNNRDITNSKHHFFLYIIFDLVRNSPQPFNPFIQPSQTFFTKA